LCGGRARLSRVERGGAERGEGDEMHSSVAHALLKDGERQREKEMEIGLCCY